ncbi:SUMF1/EgtB/PvdO family nonheme iron enzyme [bacterium]|nr:SUMF1/EgtB/PvdO family nonheme iron enzyme [bacterium]
MPERDHGDQPVSDEQFDNLILEFYEQLDRGESPSPDDFIAAHPEYSDELELHFADVAAIELIAGPTAPSSHVEQTLINSDTKSQSLDGTFISQTQKRQPFLGDAAGDLPLDAFGRYTILKELGRGAMGAVYLAKDEQLDREVALKIPKFDGDADPGILDRFYREARSAAALHHPGICPIFDVGEIDGQHYITMAFIKGHPLRDITKSSARQDGQQVAHVIRCIALAMTEAHAHQVVHRDLKPANVMINTKNEPVVMDFGLALRSVEGEERLTHSGMTVGTPAYMSPEQVDGDLEKIDTRSDIYSLGVIFYELLTGQLPFQGSLLSILRQIATDDPPPPAEVCDGVDLNLQDLCLRMLAKEPADRPESMEKVAEELTSWLSGQRSSTDSSSVPETSSVRPLTQTESENAQTAAKLPTRPASGAAAQVPPWKKPTVLLGALGGVGVLLAIVMFFLKTPYGTLRVEVFDPDIEVSVKSTGIVVRGTDTQGVEVSPGDHILHVKGGAFDFDTTETLSLKKGDDIVVKVELTEGQVQVLHDGKIIGSARPAQSPSGEAIADSTAGGVQDLDRTQSVSGHSVDPDAPPPAVAPFDAGQARAHQQAWADYLGLPVEKEIELPHGEKMAFMLIPPGEFMMGTSDEDIARLSDILSQDAGDTFAAWCLADLSHATPQHRVRITRPFYLGKYEVTLGQWDSVMGDNPSQHMDRVRNPTDYVVWDQAQRFCHRLTETLGDDKAAFELPTEAQWEYACRAGTTSDWSFGSAITDIDQYARYKGNTPSGKNADKTIMVGTFQPNAFGLYDMHGNVQEWCLDWFADAYDPQASGDDPMGPATGDQRVVRGGSFFVTPYQLRSAHRVGHDPRHRTSVIGFRVAMAIDTAKLKTAQTARPESTAGSPGAPPPAVAPFDEAQAKAHQQAWADHLGVPVEYTNSMGMKFRLIPPGEFLMGSTPEEVEAALKMTGEDENWQAMIRSEAPRHRVILTRPVYVGVTEVTQAQYEQVVGTNPSYFSPSGDGRKLIADRETGDHPVEMVSWNDASEFCAKLSQREDLTPFDIRSGETVTPLDGTGYRLPTEAEWEYACRAGTTTQFWGGDSKRDLSENDWIGHTSDLHTHPVGELKANPFGLTDVLGNVWEWVEDGWDPAFYGKFTEHAARDPFSPFAAGSQRICRGGGWGHGPPCCRSSYRRPFANPPTGLNNVGYRVVLPVDAVKKLLGNPAEKAPPPAVAPFDEAQAKAHQKAWANYLELPIEKEVELPGGETMRFILVPPGEFNMGSDDAEFAALTQNAKAISDSYELGILPGEGPQHRVRITRPFYLGTHEVMQAQWQAVMDSNPSTFKDSPDSGTHPVENVSWTDCQKFLASLEKGPAGDQYDFTLPTEAQWEYACRAGTVASFNIADEDELKRHGWFFENSGKKTQPVGQLRPNSFGLYDMLGNVQEWCADWYATNYYAESPVDDPKGPETGSGKVFRGGAYNMAARRCRAAIRDQRPPAHPIYFGFRVALTIDTARLKTEQTTRPGATAGLSSSADTPPPAVAPIGRAQTKAPDKTVADWILELGGTVTVEGNIVSSPDALPLPPFRLQGLKLHFTGAEILDPQSPANTAADGVPWELLPQLRDLTSVEFFNFRVPAEGFEQLGQVKTLSSLVIAFAPVTTDNVVALTKLPALTKLGLHGNPQIGAGLTDADLVHLTRLPLTELSLFDTKITNDGLKTLAQIPNLTLLGLQKTAIDDDGLQQLVSLKNLKAVFVGKTAVTDAGIAALREKLPECDVRRK